MSATFTDDWTTIYHGDCLTVMSDMEPESVDAIVTDPPYGLSFMGREWDHGVPGEAFWREALRVAKPGAHLVAFGGTRTYHRLACAIEDAGWEVRDTLGWLYGSGFPKSLDVSKAIDKRRHDQDDVRRVTAWVATARSAAGITNRDIDAAFGFNGMAGHWTTQGAQAAIPTLDQVPTLLAVLGINADDVPDEIRALLVDLNGMKGQPGPAWFRREVIGTRTDVATRIYDMGKGPRLPDQIDVTAPSTDAAQQWAGWGTALKPAWEPCILARKPLTGTVAANVQRWGTGAINIDGCRIETSEAWDGRSLPNAQDGVTWAGSLNTSSSSSSHPLGRWPANIVHDGSDEVLAVFPQQTSGANPTRRGGLGYHGASGQAECDAPRGTDSGSAARFFYCAKATKAERDEGLYAFEERFQANAEFRPNHMQKALDGDSGKPHGRYTPRRNFHPTVKPLDLMRWLVRLVTPPDGVVLDPFMGSGTTLKAARAEGHRSIGIDLEREHCEIAWGRLSQGVLL